MWQGKDHEGVVVADWQKSLGKYTIYYLVPILNKEVVPPVVDFFCVNLIRFCPLNIFYQREKNLPKFSSLSNLIPDIPQECQEANY